MLPFSVWHILTGARFCFIAHSILIKYSWSKRIWPNEKSNGDTSYACFNSIFVSADEQACQGPTWWDIELIKINFH